MTEDTLTDSMSIKLQSTFKKMCVYFDCLEYVFYIMVMSSSNRAISGKIFP